VSSSFIAAIGRERSNPVFRPYGIRSAKLSSSASCSVSLPNRISRLTTLDQLEFAFPPNFATKPVLWCQRQQRTTTASHSTRTSLGSDHLGLSERKSFPRQCANSVPTPPKSKNLIGADDKRLTCKRMIQVSL
jgi:hypothetical protein